MESQPTCGQGLAEHAGLPGKVGDVIAALADNLEQHLSTLDLTDENARNEHEVYRQLSQEHRAIANQLRAVAARMASYRDLPMGRHDENAVSDPQLLDAFRTFLDAEHELHGWLEQSMRRDRVMLEQSAHATP